MRKFLFIVTLAFFCLSFGLTANATDYNYIASVFKMEATTVGEMELTPVTSGITFKVLTINTDTAATLTVFNSTTSLTNPVTTTNFAAAAACNGKVKFTTTASTVDLIVVDTAGGYSVFVEDFSPNDHKIVIDERPNIAHHGMIWFTASDATETDTGVDFQTDTRIELVNFEVDTVDATETIDIGLLSTEDSGSGDPDGFVYGASVGTLGMPLLTLTTSGAYMDDGTNFDPDGMIIEASSAVSLTYTGSAGTDTAAGYIHYFFTRLR
jgi:hypothetical protein